MERGASVEILDLRTLLPLDRDAIRKALHVRYERVGGIKSFVDPDEYVEKVITLAFHIPPMTDEGVSDYMATLAMSPRWTDDCRMLLRVGLEPNPRRLKRFINGVEMLFDLLESSDGPSSLPAAERAYFVKLHCIGYRWSHFFDRVAERPQALADYLFNAQQHPYDKAIAEFRKAWPDIADLATSRDLFDFVKSTPSLAGLAAPDLRRLVSLVSR